MAKFLEKDGVLLLFLLIVLSVIVGILPVQAETVHPFSDEVKFIQALDVMPEKDWSENSQVSSMEYVVLLEKIFNGRQAKKLYNLTESATLPNTPISYQEALAVAGMFLGYSKEESYQYVQTLTTELKKKSLENINDYEMGYIFYTLLHSPRKNKDKSLLEERYVLGEPLQETSRVIQVQSDKILLKGEESIPLAPDFLAFTKQGQELFPVDLSQISIDMTDFHLLLNAKKQVVTAIISPATPSTTTTVATPERSGFSVLPSTIRILLSRDLSPGGGNRAYDFHEIKVVATQPFKIVQRDQEQKKTVFIIDKNQVVRFSRTTTGVQCILENDSRTVEGRVYLESYQNTTTSFEPFISSSTSSDVKVYSDKLEIIPSNQAGYLYLVNELPLEMYLRRVVISQIPQSWEEEAFKVQVIAARTYAISQILRNKLGDKFADVDDGTVPQIYQTIAEESLVNKAIDETRGMILTYEDEVIDAVFFSTSSGSTANNGEVWHNSSTNAFPGGSIPYLHAKSQLTNGSLPDLTDEANALAFYQDWTVESFDMISPYFRWQLELGREELENTINRNLPLRERADRTLGTDFIQTLSGQPIIETGFSIGQLQDLRVVKRGTGGNIMILDIIGSKGSYRVYKEYNIRFLLRPNKESMRTGRDIIIETYGGGSVKNYSILPSAFAAFEILYREDSQLIEKVIIYGGGNGHGVGLSQWGMQGMAKAGYDFKEILKHYYPGVHIEQAY